MKLKTKQSLQYLTLCSSFLFFSLTLATPPDVENPTPNSPLINKLEELNKWSITQESTMLYAPNSSIGTPLIASTVSGLASASLFCFQIWNLTGCSDQNNQAALVAEASITGFASVSTLLLCVTSAGIAVKRIYDNLKN